MVKELEEYLRSDWWPIGDACQIFAGFVPISGADDVVRPSKSIRISDGEICCRIGFKHLETEVREKWTGSFHWYEEPGSTKFIKTSSDDHWDWKVSKTYAILWALDQNFRVQCWVNEAVDLGLLAEIP